MADAGVPGNAGNDKDEDNVPETIPPNGSEHDDGPQLPACETQSCDDLEMLHRFIHKDGEAMPSETDALGALDRVKERSGLAEYLRTRWKASRLIWPIRGAALDPRYWRALRRYDRLSREKKDR